MCVWTMCWADTDACVCVQAASSKEQTRNSDSEGVEMQIDRQDDFMYNLKALHKQCKFELQAAHRRTSTTLTTSGT